MKVVVIPADSGLPIRVDEIEGRIGLEYLQKQVAGYIEPINITLGDEDASAVSMYVNEEGKLQGLPYNPRATFLAQDSIMAFDYIAGDAVVVGPVDDEGDDTGLTEAQVEALNQPIGAAWFQQ